MTAMSQVACRNMNRNKGIFEHNISLKITWQNHFKAEIVMLGICSWYHDDFLYCQFIILWPVCFKCSYLSTTMITVFYIFMTTLHLCHSKFLAILNVKQMSFS